MALIPPSSVQENNVFWKIQCDLCGLIAGWMAGPEKTITLAENKGYIITSDSKVICPNCQAPGQDKSLPTEVSANTATNKPQ